MKTQDDRRCVEDSGLTKVVAGRRPKMATEEGGAAEPKVMVGGLEEDRSALRLEWKESVVHRLK